MVEKNPEGKPGENTPMQQSWSEVDKALKDANWKVENSEIDKRVVESEERMIVDEQARQNNEEKKNESVLAQIKTKQEASTKKEGQPDGGVY